nr:aldehyde dehydrogenase family protein [Actinomycetota bacterium]
MSTDITTGRTAWTTLRFPAPAQSFVKASGEPLESFDPATGELVATVRVSTTEDVAAAVEHGRAAWDRGGWRSDGAQRARVLYG